MSTSNIRTAAQTLLELIRRDATPAELAELSGPLHELGMAVVAFAGVPYEYGIPGSDPNVEQLPDGRLRVTLLQPLVSGSERIEVLMMSPGTVGDQLVKSEVLKSTGNETRASVHKVAKQLRTEGGRPITVTEMDGLLEEEAVTLFAASDFLGGRFRRTRRVFRTG